MARVRQALPSRLILAGDGGLTAEVGTRALCRFPARRQYWTVTGQLMAPARPDGVTVWHPLDTPQQLERRAAPRATERWPVAYVFPGESTVRTGWTVDVSTRGARFGYAGPVLPQ